MQEMIRKMWRDDEAQDLVEYALIAGLVSVICWVAIQASGQSISTVWGNVKSAMSAASAGS